MEIARLTDVGEYETWQHTRVNGMMIRFANDYGASIVHHDGSYGVELAVVAFGSSSREDWEIVYDTPITDDVIGWLDPMTLIDTLRRIAALPRYHKRLTD